ncbi:MAG: HAMP domain-containing histidine kinase [Spirochaetes bacterium]|nr:HAMP domain-containing histidine kinase [Spirochaetota bacterium]
MQNIYPLIKTVFLTTASLEFAALVFRLSRRESIKEYLWFASALVFFILRAAFADTITFRIIFSLLFIWSAGSYLDYISGYGRNSIWTAAVGILGIVDIIIGMLGYYGTLPFSIFYIFTIGLASLYPLGFVFRYYLRTREGLFLYFFIAFAVWMCSALYDSAASLFMLKSIHAVLLVSFAPLFGLFFFIFGEGYLKGAGLKSYYRRMDRKDEQIKSVYAQLIQTESTMIVNDRLIASGLLAAGSAHEFKNMLSSINIAAEYGLAAGNTEEKDRSFGAIIDSIKFGKEVVTDLLEKLAIGGREKEEVIDIKNDIRYLFKIVKIAYRMEGIRFTHEVEDETKIYGRKGEIEQIILNIIRNAVDAFKTGDKNKDKNIHIKSAGRNGSVIIEITDNAGGIPSEITAGMFETAVSGRQSTGLGLYLTRALVQRNGGEIEYLSVEGGSCFRMMFLSRES